MHRLLERGHQPVVERPRDAEPVDDQVDGVDFVAVELHAGRDFADFAVDAGVDVALLGQALEELAVVTLAPLDDGGHQRNLPPGEPLGNQCGNLFVGIVDHLLARDRRVSPRSPRIEQAQEIADLGYGTDRRTGILVGGLLLDGHHRAEARDLIDVGPFHRSDELPGIGRKRLHIAALPFGIDRIESQGRLAGTRKSCDDDQFPARNFQIDVLQVMHPRTEYFDVVFFHDE